jgi:hypothetical protein
MSTTQANKFKAAQWFTHVEQWRASGLTRSAYCQQHCLTIRAFNRWIARHQEKGSESGTLTLIAANVSVEGIKGLPSELILYCPNGSKLHLPATTPTVWLGALLCQLR